MSTTNPEPPSGLSPAFFIGQEIVELRPEQLEMLQEEAKHALLRRARLCLHQDRNDTIQEMIIALCRDSHVRVHRHVNSDAFSESLHLLSGELLVVIFDKVGNVVRRIELAPFGSGKAFLYRLAGQAWHTVIPLTEVVIYHETSVGPFSKAGVEYAEWCPSDQDREGIKAYLRNLVLKGK